MADSIVPLIPVQDFFRNPSCSSFRISPDGQHIAYLKPWEQRLNVWVKSLADGSEQRLTAETDRNVAGLLWANSSVIVYTRDKGGDENFILYAAYLDGRAVLPLSPEDGAKANTLSTLSEDDQHILITHNQRDPRYFDVFKVNVFTGESVLCEQNPGNIGGWIADYQGNIRAAITIEGLESALLYRNGSEWKEIDRHSYKENFIPVGFEKDGNGIYCISNKEHDTAALILFDPDTCTTKQVLLHDAEADITDVHFSRRRHVLIGAVVEKWNNEWTFFDEHLQKAYQTARQLIGHNTVEITSMDDSENRCIVLHSSDTVRGKYYLMDIEKNTIELLDDAAPWLQEEYLCQMKPVHFTSRDGLTLHGYLTLPQNAVQPGPAVVLVHGGPWARDHWGYRPDVQFLANRGYAVLQVNFRGSLGYGRTFWEASFKQWGRTMQNDISDGVLWMIDQGIADPARVGIYGGSYGGYATLAGLAFTPELYACGVDVVGPSNIFTLLNTLPPYWKPILQKSYEMIGHPEEEADLLRSVSPVFHADKIIAPLFVVQGRNDPRVNINESDQIVEALRQRNVDVLYLVKDDEGHGFQNEENKNELFAMMETFLAQHLGGRSI
jgi:dipeptidyl aminopeptidase/acylaminoacyl peptidase